MNIYRKVVKRSIDFILSVILLAFLTPIIIVISVLILIFMGRPIFFIHERPGLNERIFRLIKFRTMTPTLVDINAVNSGKDRTTKLGSFLRASSLDEIPELFNVIKGEMSLVGPRPLLKEYLATYTKYEKKRHLVRPGITGLAQVNGRNSTSWPLKMRLDIYYVNNMSFKLDLKIVLNTIVTLFDIKSADYHSSN